MNKLMKRILTLLLSTVLCLTVLPCSFTALSQTSSGSPDFDADHIVLRLGALSDPHFIYEYDSVASTETKMQYYADLAAALDTAADHQLNAILNMGDYTSLGNYTMALTACETFRGVFGAINADKSESEKTRFMFTYGNHDTCWEGNMAISAASPDYETLKSNTFNRIGGEWYTWEKLLDEYGLLADQGAHIDEEVAGEGCYWYEIPTAAGNYYVLSLETASYANNDYTDAALAWLDAKLGELTEKGTSERYIYVISHAPIAESGVYGADIELEKNADWAGKDKNGELDAVLKQYPQVVYLSGHSHFANLLESTVMAKNYTAVTVGSTYNAQLSSSESGYLDSATAEDPFGLLIEVDQNGNQRIRRISHDQSTARITLTMNGKTVTNYGQNSAAYPTVPSVSVTASSLVKGTAAEYGKAWLSPAPAADGSHLVFLSAARGAVPVFDSAASIDLSNSTYALKENRLKAEIRFSTASCTSKILQYRISIFDERGAPLGSWWAYGNWNTVTAGVVEGTSHLDATRLGYTISGIPCMTDRFYAEIVAVDEFGNQSKPLRSELFEPELPAGEPHYQAADDNAFDSLTDYHGTNGSPRIRFSGSGSEIVTTWNNASIASSGWDKAHYFLDPEKYSDHNVSSIKGSWGLPYQHPDYFTPFGEADRFAYEADFCITGGSGYILFGLREDAALGANNALYTGIRIYSGSIQLVINNKACATKAITPFGHGADGKTHHLAVISYPKKMSVWIDGVLIFDEAPFYASAATGMTPCMYIWGQNINGTVSHQKMYLYDPADAIDAALYRDRMEMYAARIRAAEGSYRTLRTDVEAIVAAAEQAVDDLDFDMADNAAALTAYRNIRDLYRELNFGREYFLSGKTTLIPSAGTEKIFTETPTGFIYNLSENGYDTIGQSNYEIHYPVVMKGLPFGAADSYTVSYDVRIDRHIVGKGSSQDMRMMFSPGSVNGVKVYLMLQGNTVLTSTADGGWTNCGVASGINIYTDGMTVHAEYEVKEGKTVIGRWDDGKHQHTYTMDLTAIFGEGFTLVPEVSLTWKKATFTVSDLHIAGAKGKTVLGDVDGDGGVENTDRTMLARYLAEWGGLYENIDKEAADVDQNSDVENTDRTILARYLAEWGGEYDLYFR